MQLELPSDIIDSAIESRLALCLSEELSDPEWDSFLRSVPGGHHLQSGLWAQTKAVMGWKTVRIVVRQNDTILAGAQLLIRSVAPFFSVAYLTKGPILAAENPSLVNLIIECAIHVCRINHLQMLSVQPPNNGENMTPLLLASGFHVHSLELAPTATVLLDLTCTQEQILSQMKRQTRQNIRRSEHGELAMREGGETDLDSFYRLHLATSRRQGFVAYPLKYFVQMWRSFGDSNSIKLFLAECGGECISALLVIPFGNTVIPKILGWCGRCSDQKPNDAVFWSAIKWAKAHGYGCFDLEGIDRAGAMTLLRGDPLPDRLRQSPDFFKLGFGGEVVLYPTAHHKVLNPVLGWLFQKVDPKIGGHDLASRVMDRLRKR